MDSIITLLLKYPKLSSSLVQGLIYSASFLLFLRAFWIIIQTFRHLRKVSREELKNKIFKSISAKDPLMLLTAKLSFSAYKESFKSGNLYPRSFIEDATRQIAANTFADNYIVSITNISNLFPPLGFIGTVFGMIFIFLAKSDPNSTLNTVGLGAALFTTLGALTLFVIVDGFRILLDRVATKRIDMALSLNLGKLAEIQVEKENEAKK